MFDSLNGIFGYYAHVALLIVVGSLILSLATFFILSKLLKIRGMFALTMLIFSGAFYGARMIHFAAFYFILFLAGLIVSISRLIHDKIRGSKIKN